MEKRKPNKGYVSSKMVNSHADGRKKKFPYTTKGKAAAKKAAKKTGKKVRKQKEVLVMVNKTGKRTAKRKTTARKSKSKVNSAGNYTKPTMRKRLFESIKAGGGWSPWSVVCT